MKTALSIPDPLFKKGEKAARKLKLSRSELYAQALAEYLERRNEEALIARINKVCDTLDTRIDPAMTRAAAGSLPKDQW
jgi:metal-responsive CopG/Arc/MetJ family transcriptional regulator